MADGETCVLARPAERSSVGSQTLIYADFCNYRFSGGVVFSLRGPSCPLWWSPFAAASSKPATWDGCVTLRRTFPEPAKI